VIPDTLARQKGVGAFLINWLVPVVLLLAGFAVWSNHVQAGFHGDDFHVVVKNRAIRSLDNFPRFFTQPRAFSSEPEYADYKPLLLMTLALDAAVSNLAVDPALAMTLRPLIFQLDSVIWFAALVGALYLLFSLVPGTPHSIAVAACGLVLLHPVAAETVNYISQRGQIMAAVCVTLALALWIIWPRWLPQTLGLNLDRVPQTWWQFQVRENGAQCEQRYKAFLALPIPFYLIPLVPGLLSEPSAAFFVLLAFIYAWIYDRKYGYYRFIVPAAICSAYWIIQTAVVWRATSIFRIPAFSYWISQPWVTLRYLFSFAFPFGLNADSGLAPLPQHSPVWVGIALAAAGVGGVACLFWTAVWLRQRQKWQGVAFGILWFLVALIPTALIPQRTVEANPRMFFAMVGLAFATAHLGGILWTRLGALATTRSQEILLASVGGLFLVLTGSALGGMTWQRNNVWGSEKSLWLDVTTRSPQNGRGLINYSAAMFADDDEVTSLAYLERAVPFCKNDAVLELALAQGFDLVNKAPNAEDHFRRAVMLAPGYASANGGFGRWLVNHQRNDEGFGYAAKGRALNATDLVSRHTLMDIYSQRSDWAMVIQMAKEALRIDPEDADGQRSLVVAQASIDQVSQAEADAKNSPGVDDFLKLSVIYYHAKRYEDCVKASRSALELRPNLAEAYANMATALHALGRDDEAIIALQEVVRLRPDMEFAKVDLRILLDKRAVSVRQ
jgi:tetratricopeptide (TPR) repeat protein